MDKFDDYLEKQSKCEKEKFVLPQSFDRKVEDILLNLDSELKKENNIIWIKYSKRLRLTKGSNCIFKLYP